jgi:uncharacterized membrane protein
MLGYCLGDPESATTLDVKRLEKAIEMESIEKDRTRSLGARQYAAEQKVYWLKVAEAIEAFGGRWTPQYYSRV